MGYKHSEEMKAKLSEMRKGFKHSPETIAKMSASRKGKIPSAETREKMRLAKLGKPHSAEHSAKIAAGNRGKTISTETRAKIGAGRRAFCAAQKAKKPLYVIRHAEIGSFVQWFQHGETKGQIQAALTLFTSPKGHYELLMQDGTAEDYERLVAEHEDLRPLTKPNLRVV